MTSPRIGQIIAMALIVLVVGWMVVRALGARPPETPKGAMPEPSVDEQKADSKHLETVVLAGGCFWGVQGVFEHIRGVTSVVAGYSGGRTKSPNYGTVSLGITGHAESVQITYDTSQITFGQLLTVFFSVAHDPTQLNRQGPDTGSQYRSAIFYSTNEQKRIADGYIAQLNGAKIYSRPIVTEVQPLTAFYPAEDYHQDYMKNHPDAPYIVYNDLPKLAELKKEFPQLCRKN